MRGLVLEGGGAKGSFHIGAVKALFEMGYTFEGVSGTSIGAFNAAMIVSGDFEELLNLWTKMDTSTLFDFDDEVIQDIARIHITPGTITYLAAKIKKLIETKGIDITKLKKFILDHLNEEKIRASHMDFALVTVSLSDLRPLQLRKEEIPLGQLAEYVMASASFPGFRTSPIGKKYYIDGGLYNNLPIDVFIDRGYDEIIAIRTFCIGRVKKPKKADNVKITYILPPEQLGNILIFDNEVILKNIKLGYFEARRVMLGHRGHSYYLERVPTEEKIFSALCEISEENLREIGKILGITKMEGRRLLFEKVMPLLASAFDLEAGAKYSDIIIAAMEKVATKAQLERFVLYSFGEFAKKVYKRCKLESINPSIPMIRPILKETEGWMIILILLKDFCRNIIADSN
jgi:NTE family protein